MRITLQFALLVTTYIAILFAAMFTPSGAFIRILAPAIWIGTYFVSIAIAIKTRNQIVQRFCLAYAITGLGILLLPALRNFLNGDRSKFLVDVLMLNGRFEPMDREFLAGFYVNVLALAFSIIALNYKESWFDSLAFMKDQPVNDNNEPEDEFEFDAE